MKLSLVLLTLNEREAISELYDRIAFDAVDEVFVVDGGSTDGTVAFFRARGLTVIPQQRPGRGEAFRVGARHAAGDAIIFFSPDGNEDPADMPKFRPYLEQGYDLVIASRMMRGGRNEEDAQRLKARKWVNQVLTLIVNLVWNGRGWLAGRYVTDTINGFRAIQVPAFNVLALDVDDYTIEFQMTIRALRRGLRIAEFPTVEGSRMGGKSKVRSFEGGLRFLRTLLRELAAPRRSASRPAGVTEPRGPHL